MKALIILRFFSGFLVRMISTSIFVIFPHQHVDIGDVLLVDFSIKLYEIFSGVSIFLCGTHQSKFGTHTMSLLWPINAPIHLFN